MYRGKPYINRHVRKWDQERDMEQHVSNLCHIRPRTGTIEHDQIVINNRKRQMIKQDRFTEIQRQNRILLQKISHIMSKPKPVQRSKLSHKQTNKSLNSSLRKKKLQDIQIENAKLLKRLQQKKSDYQTQKFRVSWKKQKSVIKNLSNFPLVISDRKKKRSSASAIGGGYAALRNMNTTSYHNNAPKSKMLQQSKLRTIDGMNFLITVRMSKECLQIIGDTNDRKDIKVIQIDRKQAVQFIEQECGGKLENIFDRLRYDKVDEVLYLVGQNLSLDQVKSGSRSPRKYQDNPQFDISVKQQKLKVEDRAQNDGQQQKVQDNKKQTYWVPKSREQKQQQSNNKIDNTNNNINDNQSNECQLDDKNIANIDVEQTRKQQNNKIQIANIRQEQTNKQLKQQKQQQIQQKNEQKQSHQDNRQEYQDQKRVQKQIQSPQQHQKAQQAKQQQQQQQQQEQYQKQYQQQQDNVKKNDNLKQQNSHQQLNNSKQTPDHIQQGVYQQVIQDKQKEQPVMA